MSIIRTGRLPIMNRVVAHQGLLHLGGVIADDRSAGIGGQMAQIAAKIDSLLAEHGSDKRHILSATVFTIDMAHKNEMNEAWLAWLPDDALPTRATIGVSDLGAPDILLEVTLCAAQKA